MLCGQQAYCLSISCFRILSIIRADFNTNNLWQFCMHFYFFGSCFVTFMRKQMKSNNFLERKMEFIRISYRSIVCDIIFGTHIKCLDNYPCNITNTLQTDSTNCFNELTTKKTKNWIYQMTSNHKA